MAEKLQLSNPQVAALMRQRKKLIAWRSMTYDDEVTLMNLRDAHPDLSWHDLRGLFNASVPQRRKRSVDSIKNKWRQLKARFGQVEQLTVKGFTTEEFTALQNAPASQTILETQFPRGYNEKTFVDLQATQSVGTSDGGFNDQYNPSIEDHSFTPLDTLNRNYAEYSEMLYTHWETMNDFDGYLASIADDLERAEAARMLAIASTSGWSEGMGW